MFQKEIRSFYVKEREGEAKRPLLHKRMIARANMSASCLHYCTLYLKHVGTVLGRVLRENSRRLNREES